MDTQGTLQFSKSLHQSRTIQFSKSLHQSRTIQFSKSLHQSRHTQFSKSLHQSRTTQFSKSLNLEPYNFQNPSINQVPYNFQNSSISLITTEIPPLAENKFCLFCKVIFFWERLGGGGGENNFNLFLLEVQFFTIVTSLTPSLHGKCGMVWYRTLRVNVRATG